MEVIQQLNKNLKHKKYRCPDCNKTYISPNLLSAHVEKEHKDLIPDGVTVKQYLFNRRNNKTFSICVICKKHKTMWNEETGHYNRFCSEECKSVAAQQAKENMIRVYGQEHLLNDPEHQREMLANRSISGTYTFSDGKTKIRYTGTYELDFLKYYDIVMKLPPLDIIECPHIFYYFYEGKKNFYIPDFYMPDIKLIIEIKDGGDNPNNHPKIIAVDKVKEGLKDQAVINAKSCNYIKIQNKNYIDFVATIEFLKTEPLTDNPDKIVVV